jgi:hypothetical protein
VMGPGVVVHICNPSYSRGGGKSKVIMTLSLKKKTKTNKLKVKGLGLWFKPQGASRRL